MPTLLSLQVGRVRSHTMAEGVRTDFRHANWTSGIFKTAVAGAVEVTERGIAGDEQSDLKHHGGPDNVVLAYDGEHYGYWREVLKLKEPLVAGSFGENFTVEGLSEESVCIGDTWQVGEDADRALVLQVTQPRQPCYKLARRLEQPHIVKMVRETTWGGWYLRVMRAGVAAAGMRITRVGRVHPEWTVSRAVQVMYARKKLAADAARLAGVAELSARWKAELLEE